MSQQITPYDIIFQNPDFKDFVVIAGKINDGLKIAIVFENDVPREDIFFTTQFYPFTFFSIRKKMAQLKKWRMLMDLAPHLALSKKVFYPAYSPFHKYRAVIADYFYGNKYHKKSQIITHGLRSIFSQLKIIMTRGIYFQEYTFNISRFYIAILKYFEKSGATVFVNQPFEKKVDRMSFKKLNQEIHASQTILGNKSVKTDYELPFAAPAIFSMYVRHPFGKFRFSSLNGHLLVSSDNETEKVYSKNEIQLVIESYFRFNVVDLKRREKDWMLFSPQNAYKLISELKGKFPDSFEGENFTDMFELCREKFDLAKQCEISFSDFQVLFHRYGKGIDEMIERVYEKMNEKKNLKTIWEEVEDEYQRRYEWKI